MKTEAKVGLFITLSLFFLFGLLSQLSSFDNFFKKSYPLVAKIDDGSGLNSKAKVKLKGVDIGYVESVTLVNNDVTTKLMIDEGVQIPKDSTITISQDSLLGGKFLDIQPGHSSLMLEKNSLLSKEQKVSSIVDASTSADSAFQEITYLVKDIRNMLDSGAKEDIERTLSNLNEFSQLLASISKDDNQTIHQILANTNSTIKNTNLTISKFATMSDEISRTSQDFAETSKAYRLMSADLTNAINSFTRMNDNIAKTSTAYRNMSGDVSRTVNSFNVMSQDISETSREFKTMGANINQNLPQLMARLDNISKYLEGVSQTLDSKLPTALNKFVRLEDNVNRVIENNEDKLSKTLSSVDGFFVEGTETMEKVDKYLDSMVKSELHVEMRSDEVYDDGGYSKSHLNMTLKPDPTRYYMLGLTSGPSFEADSDFSRGYIGNKKHEKGNFLISAQYGKRFDDLLFRVGIIENQGGFGVDYFALNDTLKFSTQMSDFNAVNDVRGTNPNLTTTIRYQFFKHINAYLSGNNLLNSRANSVSVGMGVSFVDNDLKNLLGTAASSAK